MVFVKAILALCFVYLTIAQQEFYTGAVVEHVPYSVPGQVSREEAISIMNTNLDTYEGHIKAAKQSGVQIIVFPEDGLYGDDKCTREEILPYLEYIPNTEGIQPCNEADFKFPSSEHNYNLTSFDKQPILKRVSCLAQKYQIVIVLDMGDIQPCSKSNDPNCPNDHRYQYNTQVAFDEEGKLLAKYHKTHLFYEPQFNAAEPSDPKTFVTSFGVKFGMMICFDMMFGLPSEYYHNLDDVFDLVYSTWWVNTPPDFSATQIQQAWSRTMNLNLLAAGNGLNWLYSGSGIYSRGNVLQQHYNPTYKPEEYLIISKIPIFSSKKTKNQNFIDNLSNNNIQPIKNKIQLDQYHSNYIPANYSVHCPVNSSYYGENYVFPPWKNIHLFDLNNEENNYYWDYSYGYLGLVKPFLASWGSKNNSFSISSGDLSCSISFDISDNQPFLRDYGEEYYTLLAYSGWYDGQVDYYKENFCAFYRCRTDDVYSCFESLIFAGTIFDKFKLQGSYPANSTLYALAATDELRLIEEDDKFIVGPTDKNQQFDGYFQSTDEFNTILLTASLLGRVF